MSTYHEVAQCINKLEQYDQFVERRIDGGKTAQPAKFVGPPWSGKGCGGRYRFGLCTYRRRCERTGYHRDIRASPANCSRGSRQSRDLVETGPRILCRLIPLQVEEAIPQSKNFLGTNFPGIARFSIAACEIRPESDVEAREERRTLVLGKPSRTQVWRYK